MKIFLIFITSIFLSFSSFADTKISFALDWKFEGPSAPYFYAIDKGHFGEENLEVEDFFIGLYASLGDIEVVYPDIDIAL